MSNYILKKEEIAAIFSEKLGIQAPADPIELARIAREVLRDLGRRMSV